MMDIYFLFWCIYLSLTNIDAARILAVFPSPSISHQVVYRPLVHELLKRGHEVVLITTDPAFPNGGAPANLKEIDIHDISYTHKELMAIKLYDKYETPAKMDIKTNNLILTNFLTSMLEMQLKSDTIQKLLNDKSEKFDLILIEAYVRLTLVFTHLFHGPVIQVSSFGSMMENLDTVGALTHPILYPINFTRKINCLNILDKFQELFQYVEYKYLVRSYEENENEMLRRVFGQNTPAPRDLTDNVDMVFLNVNPFWESNRPVPPNIVYLGGLHQKPERKLLGDIKKYLDSSKNGVIYMSLGTNIYPSMLPLGTTQIFLNVLSTLPYNILWKWSEEFSNLPKNIKISKWFPQSDLLRHPNVKLFITQGGLQSTEEAITAGVPLVGIPGLLDQWYNVEMYERYNIGVGLDVLSLTEDRFRNAIMTILNDNSYKENIIKLRTIMYDRPETSLERAVWWTEHVLRHGGARHLRSPAANMPWTQYYEIELVTYLLVALVVMSVIIVIIIKLMFKMILTILVRKFKVKVI